MNNRGMSVVELIIVIVIMAIISTFAVIGVSRYMETTKIKGDTNTVATLNSVTSDYAFVNNLSNDIFNGLDTDEDRINALIDDGFLSHSPEVLQDGAAFVWSVEEQLWTLEGGVLDGYTGGSLNFDFSTDNKTTVTDQGMLFRNDNGWEEEDGYLESVRGEQRAFVPIGKSSYTITNTAQLSAGSGGGYGIYFDTILVDDNVSKDSGWILQFDRGYDSGSFIVRPRTEGRESGPVWVLKGRDTDLFPSIQQDASWWTESHTIKISVSQSGNEKTATFFVDGINLGSYTYTFDNSDGVMTYTGFRTWSSPTTKFYSISVN